MPDVNRPSGAGPGPYGSRLDQREHRPQVEQHHHEHPLPQGCGIAVLTGTPVCVHLEVCGQSLIDLGLDLDVWLQYVPLER